jgi:hypothetical protein
LTQIAIYLVRPDGYVALAASTQSPQGLLQYFETRGIRPG